MARAQFLAMIVGTVVAVAASAVAQEPTRIVGPWLSENRDGVIDVYRCADRVCGRLVWLKQPHDKNGKPQTDQRNPKPELRTRPVCGLTMLGDLRPKGVNEWGGGWIYSPRKGKTYDASMRLEGEGLLKLRVDTPLIGETQTWTRADPRLVSCPAG
jgi:uncharacterized protein (DUF2147 family)